MPKKGPDKTKITKIRKTLKRNPNGLWVREIARKTVISRSTVSIYLNEHMKNEIEEVYPMKGQLVKIVRLKE